MDVKDLWSETYYNAIEDGYTTWEAEKLAEEAVMDYEWSLTDDAMNRMREADYDEEMW